MAKMMMHSTGIVTSVVLLATAVGVMSACRRGSEPDKRASKTSRPAGDAGQRVADDAGHQPADNPGQAATDPDWSQAPSRVEGPVDKDMLECATLGGLVACRGWNQQGVLGRGFFDLHGKELERRPDWKVVAGVENVVAIAMAIDAYAMCALAEDGSVKCWGSNVWGQLGQGWIPQDFLHDETRARAQPAPVAGLPPVASISGGLFRFCAIDRAHGLWCWGNNWYHAIDDTKVQKVSRPVKIKGVPAVAKIGTCFFQTCAIGTDSSLWCWGSVRRLPNKKERLDVPTKIVDRDVADVVCNTASDASNPVCVVSKSGQRTCWDTDPDVVHSHK